MCIINLQQFPGFAVLKSCGCKILVQCGADRGGIRASLPPIVKKRNIVRFARRRVVARLNIGHSSSSKMSCRRPEVGDIVILAPGHVKELKGLFLGVSATVIQYDTNDPGLCYQVKLSPTSGSDLSETPWFSAADIVLKDPSSPIPQPIEPESNACCGSQCPDCVWVRYFESCKVYEKRTGFSISPEPPT